MITTPKDKIVETEFSRFSYQNTYSNTRSIIPKIGNKCVLYHSNRNLNMTVFDQSCDNNGYNMMTISYLRDPFI